MDKNLITSIGAGVVAVAALVVAANDAVDTKELVPASLDANDIAVAEIAKVDPASERKTCERKWATVRVEQGPELVWLCDGAYLPAQQQWLDDVTPHDAVRVELEPRQEGEKLAFDATVYTGELPLKPLPVVKVKDKPKDKDNE
jgi:hypothetical protein